MERTDEPTLTAEDVALLDKLSGALDFNAEHDWMGILDVTLTADESTRLRALAKRCHAAAS